MLVAVTGASGLIGTALVRRLQAEGHQVLRLTRSRPSAPDQVRWDPAAGELDPDALAKADAVVHLAAKNIGEHLRWNARTKRELLESRVEGTGLVARTMAEPGHQGARGERGGPRGAGVRVRGRVTTATGATRCSPSRAAAAPGSWPTWCGGGRRPPTRPGRPGCGSCTCAPASSRTPPGPGCPSRP